MLHLIRQSDGGAPPHHISRAIQRLNSAHTFPPDANVYSSLLRSCVSSSLLHLGLQIHSRLLKTALSSFPSAVNSLLSLHLRLNAHLTDARKLFDELPHRDAVSWTSMISGYVRAGSPHESLRVFGEMREAGVPLGGFALSAAIKACALGGYLLAGRCLHGMVFRLGFASSCVISSTLIDMYGRNCMPDDSVCVFEDAVVLDAVCWTSVISSCARNDRFAEALLLFYAMKRKHGFVIDSYTIGTLLTILGNLGMLMQGTAVHGVAVTSGLCGNVIVGSSLVDMYAKCSSLLDSQKVFDRMPTKNAVSWCALLGGYCQNGAYESTFKIFREMDKEDLNYSFGMVLRACAGLAALKHGKQVHCQFVKRGFRRDVIVESALVDLYAKCGLVDYAYRVFIKMGDKNLITWNTIIFGLAKNGRGRETVDVFDSMLKDGMSPDYVSFVGVLFACSHSGLLDEGKTYFKMMSDYYGMQPGVEHYNCLVNLLGLAGLFGEAEDLISCSPFRGDSSLWANLLGACSTYTNSAVAEVAERIAKRMVDLDPNDHLSYVLLANVYKAIGRWDDATKIRNMMRKQGAKKKPGRSWIDVKSDIHSFLVHGSKLSKRDYSNKWCNESWQKMTALS